MWVLQAFVFWNGMDTIRKFIDFCGPAVYVVMIVLAGYLIVKAGWDNVSSISRWVKVCPAGRRPP